MARAQELVEQFVAAGFRKLHLDCSMPCADDPSPLPESTVASRAAVLCAAAERTWQRVGGEAPVYVIGTEVPAPGGADDDLHELRVTTPEAARATIAAHRSAFADAGLADAWPRALALVVQPGVEFDHHKVIDYRPDKARALSASIAADPQFVCEAHSTDYQTPANLQALVRDHFAILKVGPAATFALRETLWALDAIERELSGTDAGGLRAAVMAVMHADPRQWRGYYRDDGGLALDLSYSLSDRIRYYWPHPDVQRACDSLLASLRRRPPPLTLVSQYLPLQYARHPVGPARGFGRRAAARRHREGAATVPASVRAMTPGSELHAQPDDFPGLTAAELAQYGAAWTAREIAQQPDLWLQVAQLVRAQHSNLDGFLAPLLANPALRVVLTGAGTSAFIGDCLAPALALHLGRRVDAVATTDLVTGPQLRLQSDTPTLLVSFARSGNSPESVAAVDLVEQLVHESHHLIVTCNADGALAACTQRLRNARVVVLPDATNDRGFAMTSSFSSMLLAAALAFGVIASGTVAAACRAPAGPSWRRHIRSRSDSRCGATSASSISAAMRCAVSRQRPRSSCWS